MRLRFMNFPTGMALLLVLGLAACGGTPVDPNTASYSMLADTGTAGVPAGFDLDGAGTDYTPDGTSPLVGVALQTTESWQIPEADTSGNHQISTLAGTWDHAITRPSAVPELATYNPDDASGYGYVQTYSGISNTGDDYYVGVVGIPTYAGDMPSGENAPTADVVYTGTAQGNIVFYREGGDYFQSECCSGTSTVTANFTDATVDVQVAGFGVLTIDATDMDIVGNSFSGGTISVSGTIDYTSAYESANGYFFGPLTVAGVPGEVGGVLAARGASDGFWLTFVAK